MKKGRIVFSLAFSLVLSFVAFQMVNGWMQQRLEANAAGPDLSPVVVAAVEIPFGAQVEATHVKVVDWPAGAVPQGAINSAEAALGRIATQTVFPGEPLLAGRVVEHAGGSTLASFISEGMRAVAVRVDDVRDTLNIQKEDRKNLIDAFAKANNELVMAMGKDFLKHLAPLAEAVMRLNAGEKIPQALVVRLSEYMPKKDSGGG